MPVTMLKIGHFKADFILTYTVGYEFVVVSLRNNFRIFYSERSKVFYV